MKFIKIAVILSSITVAGCGDGSNSQVMSAEFNTMQSCIAGIEKNSGMSLDIITDKPDEVSGFLSNKEGFGCQRKESGTKGIYYEGWYMIK